MDKVKAQKMAARNFRANMVGHKFHHFKGCDYVVDNVVLDAHTLKLKIIYHNLHDAELVWSRDLDDFLSPVDRNKYPDVDQLFRFESIDESEEE